MKEISSYSHTITKARFVIVERNGKYRIKWSRRIDPGKINYPYTKKDLDNFLKYLSAEWVEDEVFIAKRIISSYEV